MSGLVLAVMGAVIAACAGLGSVVGVQLSGSAAAGVVAEKPDLFGKMLVLQALPGTQGIYGFLTAVLILNQIGLLGGNPVDLTVMQGWSYIGAGLPIGIIGIASGIYQGKAAVSSILMTGKDETAFAKGITVTAMVETYAILALLASILILNSL
ncbi:MAG: V-type ATP synthase subunit K [Eubacteriaceae bacterium]|jgi:V/A-type H+-transporting ATPase subunit K|nr:V-type ATP synthase subunit K [Eubacteriaceae bacterium]